MSSKYGRSLSHEDLRSAQDCERVKYFALFVYGKSLTCNVYNISKLQNNSLGISFG